MNATTQALLKEKPQVQLRMQPVEVVSETMPACVPAIEALRPVMFAARVKLSLPTADVLGLFRSIQMKFASLETTPVIHFVSPHKGEGADVIAFETAIAAARMGRHVLYVDTGAGNGRALREFRDRAQHVMQSAEGKPGQPVVLALRGTPIYYTTLPLNSGDVCAEAIASRAALNRYREVFDTIVLSSEGGLADPLARGLYALADGNVLVAEAERSRVPVMRDLRRIVEMHGGRAIGAVLNKRRFYIPKFLYWLFFRS
ncbi:MAG TPA: hypothetical protein VEF76_07715 [Patescibacteria group bacterium]|nr:hypothetical protein [Patescibacteria group bacterium]